MTLNEAIAIVARRQAGSQATESSRAESSTHRLKAASLLLNVCRFRLGMTYQQTFEYIHRRDPSITLDDWESLLYSLDSAAENGDTIDG